MAPLDVLQVDPSAFTPPYDRSLSAALARGGARVRLLTSHFPYGPVPDPDGYELIEAFYRRAHRLDPKSPARRPLKGFEHSFGMARLARQARRSQIVHYQWLTWPRLDRRLLGSAATRPRLYTLHYPLPCRDDRAACAREAALLHRFDAVVVHTVDGARRLREDLGIDPARIEQIPHGVFDYLTALPVEQPLPSEFAAVPSDTPVILFFGLLRPYKGLDVLLEAARLLDGAEIWICGMPRMDLTALVDAAARAAARVRWLPRFIADAEIPALMRRADLVVLPYREIEQSGVVYAAMAFAKPLLLTEVGGFRELVAAGAARGVVPGDPEQLAAALRTLLDDRGARLALSTRAAELARGEYSWDTVARRHLDLYSRLLDGDR